MNWSVKRNLVHISMIAFALLIGRAPELFISFMCLMALLFNQFLLPRVTGRQIVKPEERALGFNLGLVSYPASLLVLSLVFFNNQVFMAIGWAMMAFGDGSASLFGRWLNRDSVTGSGHKTWKGSMFFLIMAFPLSILLLHVLPSKLTGLHSLSEWAIILGVTTVVSMFAERSKRFIDDNVAVSVTGAVVAWAMHLIVDRAVVSPIGDWHLAAVLVAVFAVAAVYFRAIDWKGAAAGVLIASLLWLGASWYGLLVLLTFFVIGSLSSKIRFRKKQKTGYASFATSRRGWKNALANGMPAALMSLMAYLIPDMSQEFLIAMMAAMACALSDTLSSELGTAYGSKFLDLRTMKSSHPGPDGVISLTGLVLGLFGASLMAFLSWFMAGSVTSAAIVLCAGVTGNLFDSVLGAWPQRLNWMSNHSVNFASTMLAGMLAVSLM